jgi:hypothetical protein
MSQPSQSQSTADQSDTRQVLKLSFGNYQLNPQIALSKPGSKAVVSQLLDEDDELIGLQQMQRYLGSGQSSGFIFMNVGAKKSIARTILGHLPQSAKINVEAFLRLTLHVDKIRDDEAMVRVTIVLCDVAGNEAKQLLRRDKLTYEFKDLEEDWLACGVQIMTSVKAGSKENRTVIIVPDSPIMGVIYDRNDDTILSLFGSYEIRKKAGLQFVLPGVKSAPFGLRGKAATIVTSINEGLANIVANFGYDEPSPFVQTPRGIPIVGQISGTDTIPACIAAALKKYNELFIDVKVSREDAEGVQEYTMKQICMSQEIASTLISVNSSSPLGYLMALTQEESMDRVALLDAVRGKFDVEKRRAEAAAEFVNSDPDKFTDLMLRRKENLEKMKARRGGATRPPGPSNKPTPTQAGASIRFNMKR